MPIQQRQSGAISIIEMSGRLTVNDEPGVLREMVSDAFQAGARHVLIDLSSVVYVDSTRLGEIIAAYVSATRRGGRFALVGTPTRISELLTIAGLRDLFECYDTVEAARERFE